MTTQNPQDRKSQAPPDATEEEMRVERRIPFATGKSGGKMSLGGNSNAMVYVVLVALAVGISFFFFGQGNVKQQDFTTNFSNVAADIAKMKDADKSMAGDIAGIKTAVSSQGNQVAATDSKIATLSTQVVAMQSTVNNVGTQVSSQINTQVANQLAGTAKQSDISNIQSQLAGIQNSLKSIQEAQSTSNKADDARDKTIKELQDKIKTLQSSAVVGGTGVVGGGIIGGTIGNAGTVTEGQVTATVLGNSFTGSQILSFGSISANSTASQSFVIQIANGMGRTVSNIQLAVGLELFDSNNNILTNPPVPFADANNFSLSGMGMGMLWTQQSTGYAYFIGFTNSTVVGSGIFGSPGMLSQGTGIMNYTVTVSIRNNSNSVSQSINIVPIVKVAYVA